MNLFQNVEAEGVAMATTFLKHAGRLSAEVVSQGTLKYFFSAAG